MPVHTIKSEFSERRIFTHTFEPRVEWISLVDCVSRHRFVSRMSPSCGWLPFRVFASIVQAFLFGFGFSARAFTNVVIIGKRIRGFELTTC